MASLPEDQNLPSQAAALRSHPPAPSLTAALSPHLRMCQDKIPLSPFQVNPSLCNPRLLLPGNAPHSIPMGMGYRYAEMTIAAPPPQPGTLAYPHHRVLMTEATSSSSLSVPYTHCHLSVPSNQKCWGALFWNTFSCGGEKAGRERGL